MISRFCKKTVPLFLIVSILLPSGLLFYPQKTEAQVTSCLAQIGAALGISAATEETTRVANSNDGTSKSSVAGSFVEDCIFKPLVVKMAKALLNDMTRQTVNWINSGFQGNPGFAVDLGGLMQDTADQVIGEFIAQEASFLCSPFSFQVKIALAQSQVPFSRKSRCTLTSVIDNVNGFIDRNNRVSWDNWIQVTTVPKNNAYGAYQIYQDELSRKIFDVKAAEQTYLNWGRGFKDWKFCETQAEATARFRQQNGNLGAEQAVPECRRETPGAIVQEQLSKTLGMPLEQIGLANDLNAVYDALTNQLVKQIVGGATTGLLGGSRGPRRSTIPASNYSASAQPTVLSGSLGNAFESGINAGVREATAQFVDVAPTIIPTATGSTGVVTLGLPIFPQTLDLVIDPASTIVVTDGSPLVYQVSLNTNYLTGGLNFRTALKPTATMVDIPYLNVFSTVTTDVTLYNGTKLSSTVSIPGQATVGWSDVGTDTGKPFTVLLFAPKRSGVPAGNYTLETVVYDNNGDTLDIVRHQITVQ